MVSIEEYVYQFYKRIKCFHELLKIKFELEVERRYNEAGSIFPRSNEFIYDNENISYRYHGNGCTLMIDDVIIDYDLDIFDTSSIEITDWKVL